MTSPAKTNSEGYTAVQRQCDKANQSLGNLLHAASDSAVVAERAADELKKQRQLVSSTLLLAPSEQEPQNRVSSIFFRSWRSSKKNTTSEEEEEASKKETSDNKEEEAPQQQQQQQQEEEEVLSYIQGIDKRVGACKTHSKHMQMFNSARRACTSLSGQCASECEALAAQKTDVKDKMLQAVSAFNAYAARVQTCAAEETTRAKQLLERSKFDSDTQNRRLLKKSQQVFFRGHKEVTTLSKELDRAIKQRDGTLTSLLVPDRSVDFLFCEDLETEAADAEHDVVEAELAHLSRARSDLTHASFNLQSEYSSAAGIHVPAPSPVAVAATLQLQGARKNAAAAPDLTISSGKESTADAAAHDHGLAAGKRGSSCLTFTTKLLVILIAFAIAFSFGAATTTTTTSSSSWHLADTYHSFALQYNNATNNFFSSHSFGHLLARQLMHIDDLADVYQHYAVSLQDKLSTFATSCQETFETQKMSLVSFMSNKKDAAFAWCDAQIIRPFQHCVKSVHDAYQQTSSNISSTIRSNADAIAQQWEAFAAAASSTQSEWSQWLRDTKQHYIGIAEKSYSAAASTAKTVYKTFVVAPCASSGKCWPEGYFRTTHTFTGVPLVVVDEDGAVRDRDDDVATTTEEAPATASEEETPAQQQHEQQEQQEQQQEEAPAPAQQEEEKEHAATKQGVVQFSWLTILS